MADMTNGQAEIIVLAWCRRERLDGARPVMRTSLSGVACRVIDAAMFEPETLAGGSDWVQVCGLLGCYGPQVNNTPKRAPEPAPHYGYRHRPLRGYGRRRV